MPRREERETSDSSRRQLQGLPVIRRNVAGIDLGSERHWVCAPTLEGSDREVTSYAPSTRLAQALFWGEYAEAFNAERSGVLEDGAVRVHLRRWLEDQDAHSRTYFPNCL
jgi:hypothetical protein